MTALDVATGGGHVARRLRERGREVVSVDPSPGMQRRRRSAPPRTCRSPTASFDFVVTRVARAPLRRRRPAVGEMARVANRVVVVDDTLFVGRRSSRRTSCATRRTSATTARPSGAASSRRRPRGRATSAFEAPLEIEPWLARTACTGEDAARVRELLADRVDGGR